MNFDWDEIEQVFIDLELCNPATSDTPDVAFFNPKSGTIVRPVDDEELSICLADPNLHCFPEPHGDSLQRYEKALNFVDVIEDGSERIALDRLLRGRGALRRFQEYLHRSGNESVLQQWKEFERNLRQIEVRDWLDSLRVPKDDGY